MSNISTQYTLTARFDQPARNIIKDPDGNYFSLSITRRPSIDADQASEILKNCAIGITGLPQQRIEELMGRAGTRALVIDIPMTEINRASVSQKLEDYGITISPTAAGICPG